MVQLKTERGAHLANKNVALLKPLESIYYVRLCRAVLLCPFTILIYINLESSRQLLDPLCRTHSLLHKMSFCDCECAITRGGGKAPFRIKNGCRLLFEAVLATIECFLLNERVSVLFRILSWIFQPPFRANNLCAALILLETFVMYQTIRHNFLPYSLCNWTELTFSNHSGKQRLHNVFNSNLCDEQWKSGPCF